MKEYEIWVGNYHLGQGYDGPTEPQLIGTETGTTFKVACMKHELKTTLASIEEQEKTGYVQLQSLEWFYKPHNNTNGWLGQYYETQQEALKSFQSQG